MSLPIFSLNMWLHLNLVRGLSPSWCFCLHSIIKLDIALNLLSDFLTYVSLLPYLFFVAHACLNIIQSSKMPDFLRQHFRSEYYTDTITRKIHKSPLRSSQKPAIQQLHGQPTTPTHEKQLQNFKHGFPKSERMLHTAALPMVSTRFTIAIASLPRSQIIIQEVVLILIVVTLHREFIVVLLT